MNTEQLKRVISFLTERGGYHVQPRLVSVADVDFEFDGILRGPGDGAGIVVLMQADDNRMAMAISRIRALSHTMLRSGSTRPLTLVLLASNIDGTVLRDLSSICRVVQVEGSEDEEILRDLRSLLPLVLPEPTEAQADAGRLLRDALGSIASEPFVAALLSAGRRSDSAVEEEVGNAISIAIAEQLGEERK
jgi:hypothetical protein